MRGTDIEEEKWRRYAAAAAEGLAATVAFAERDARIAAALFGDLRDQPYRARQRALERAGRGLLMPGPVSNRAARRRLAALQRQARRVRARIVALGGSVE